MGESMCGERTTYIGGARTGLDEPRSERPPHAGACDGGAEAGIMQRRPRMEAPQHAELTVALGRSRDGGDLRHRGRWHGPQWARHASSS